MSAIPVATPPVSHGPGFWQRALRHPSFAIGAVLTLLLAGAAALWRHVLRNALVPIVTVMGMQFANLLAGTIVVETVFYLPGLGRLIFQSISNRDLIVVRNCVMLLAAMVVIVNFVVDLLYAAIDPRVKASDI